MVHTVSTELQSWSPAQQEQCFIVDILHVMTRVNEVAMVKVRQHRADPLTALQLFCYEQSGASFFSFILFSFFLLFVELCSYFYSQFIGTIKLFALMNTCNWLVMLEKVKVVPHL
jgi:hypothetical protein